MTLVGGHRVGLVVVEFPHRCPGDNCAIGEWIWRQVERQERKALCVKKLTHKAT